MKPAPREEMFQSTPDDTEQVSRARKTLLGVGCGLLGCSALIALLYFYLNSL
jgi:hypothetical protein